MQNRYYEWLGGRRSGLRWLSAGLTESLRTYVVKLSHGWLPIGVSEKRCSGTTDLCPQCNEVDTVPHLYRCHVRGPWRHRFLIHLHGHLRETKPAANIRCIIIKGIESGFLTGDMNDPDSIETVVQIGWFQVLKGYIPNEWTLRQETFYRRQRKKYYTGEQWTKELIGFFWTPCGKIGVKLHTHLEKTAQTTPALTPDRRHNYAYLMLAHDRHVVVVPLEERLQSRPSP